MHPRALTPINAVFVTTAISILIGLISIGSPTAFNDLVSLSVNSLYTSYFIVCALLLWRRVTGAIKVEADITADGPRYIGSGSADIGQLAWGPWRIPGLFGLCVNTFACIYMVIIIFFSFWPQGKAPTPATMNFSCLVTGSVALLSCLYYLVWAHRTYSGPVVEIELEHM